MEKKKKVLRILARVLAIVTALVCTLCMVIPSYAEETATEQDLATTIAGQEEKLNALTYQYDFQFDYASYLESIGKTYDDVFAVGKIDSDFPAYSSNQISWVAGYYQNVIVVWITLRSSSNEVVKQVNALECPNFYMGSYSSTTTVFSFDYYNMYRDNSTGEWVRLTDSTSGQLVSYYCDDGYHIDISIISPYAKGAPMLEAACSARWYWNPAKLLSLDISTSNEEIFNEGYQAGVQDGYETGYDAGVVEGWDAGHTEGYTNGLDQGYRDGYDDGMTQMSLIDLVTEIIRAPMTLIESTLNFDIFGINLSNAVKALVTMALLAVVVTIVWKAVK